VIAYGKRRDRPASDYRPDTARNGRVLALELLRYPLEYSLASDEAARVRFEVFVRGNTDLLESFDEQKAL
jgi:hypothetical protein